MKEKLKESLRKLRDGYVDYEQLTARGQGLTSIINDPVEAMLMKGGMFILLMDKLFHILPPIWFLVALWVFQKSVEYAGGWLDQRYLKMWERSEDWRRKNISRWEQKKLEGIQETTYLVREIAKKQGIISDKETDFNELKK